MPRYEYKAVPAPRRGQKAKGVKTPEDRFAHAVTLTMNELATDGWEYLRADSLPSDERTGWTGKTTELTHHLLVFRRVLPERTAPRVEPEADTTVIPRFAANRAEPMPAPVVRLGPAGDERGQQD